MRTIPTSLALLMMAMAPASAEIAMSGDFKATKACPAVQSIRKGTNPGDVKLEPGHSYPVIAKNKEDATHYMITVDGAEPPDRWVEVGCFEAADAAGSPASPAEPVQNNSPGGVDATHVLSLSWEPSFCEGHSKTQECRQETMQSPDAKRLSLHGLWPQPRGKQYCNVDPALKEADEDHQWSSLPEPEMSAATRASLAAVMPGLESGLERHEWIVHGTCFGGEADAYFSRAASLVEAVDASPVGALFAQNIGATISADDIRGAFDKAFGPGSGARVQVQCSGRGAQREISQLVVSLAGDVSGKAPIGDLIHAARSAPEGCPGGLVAKAAR